MKYQEVHDVGTEPSNILCQLMWLAWVNSRFSAARALSSIAANRICKAKCMHRVQYCCASTEAITHIDRHRQKLRSALELRGSSRLKDAPMNKQADNRSALTYLHVIKYFISSSLCVAGVSWLVAQMQLCTDTKKKKKKLLTWIAACVLIIIISGNVVYHETNSIPSRATLHAIAPGCPPSHSFILSYTTMYVIHVLLFIKSIDGANMLQIIRV